MSNMVMVEAIEYERFTYYWECSACNTEHKATRKFEKSKVCPKCGAEIVKWIGMEDEE